MQYFRSVMFSGYIVVYTLFFLPFIPILGIVSKPKIVRKMIRIWSRGIIFGMHIIVGITHKQIGKNDSNIRPVLYVSNHQSLWETIVFHVMFPDVAVVFKDSLYRFPILGWYLRNSPMIGVDRTAGAGAMKTMFRQAKEILIEGRSILIFPEGTRLPIYAKTPYHRGVALLYKKLNLPVVPIAINSGILWPPRNLKKKRGEITVSLLDTIEPGMDTKEFLEVLQTVIGHEKDRLATNLETNL